VSLNDDLKHNKHVDEKAEPSERSWITEGVLEVDIVPTCKISRNSRFRRLDRQRESDQAPYSSVDEVDEPDQVSVMVEKAPLGMDAHQAPEH